MHYGPFVMNIRAEIAQALEDYQAIRLGRVPATELPHRQPDDVDFAQNRPTQNRPTQKRTENDVAETCEHLEGLGLADFPAPRTPEGCEECLAEGTRWVALRECLACGHVGCCDSSPGTHATKHFHQVGHPVMRSIMPGDAWSWCYVDEMTGQLA